MIKKRKREELYDKFRQGAIPSGADFADLVRSQLNLLDDGIDISDDAKDPVSLRAHGEKENILDFSDTDGRKRWRISGRSEDGTKEGLNITADEQNKLYIERETGNIGISTDKPDAKLHIIQTSATDALRIDDDANDQTPLVVNSSGQVGIGTGSPVAKLHISYSGSGDILRVDDTDGDITPLIIDDNGNTGIGYPDPKAKLTINGGVSIGANEYPGDRNLYVDGDIEVGGTVVFSGGEGVGGIEINAPLTSKTEEVTIKDNLKIIPDPNQDGSDGNLSVAGDTTLGTYNKVYENQNVVTVNGRIRSGGNPESSEEQYELDVNETLAVNRVPNAPQATVKGSFIVIGNSTLGDSGSDNIYLNGKVSSNVGDVTIDDNLTVKGSTNLGDSLFDNIYLNGKVSSNVGDVTIDDNLTVTGTISSNNGPVNISDSVTISNDLNVNGFLIFDNSSTRVSGLTTVVDNFDDEVIVTEGAVKRYIDNQIVNINNQINSLNQQIPIFYTDIRYLSVPGPCVRYGYGPGCTSHIDVPPPFVEGRQLNMSQLLHVAVSPMRIYFNGDVNADDTLTCYAERWSSFIRCYCGNSEQRAYAIVALYALWRRN